MNKMEIKLHFKNSKKFIYQTFILGLNLHFKKVRKLKDDKSETKFYFVSNS